MELLWKDKKRTLFGLPLSVTHYELDAERLIIRTGVFTQIEDEVRLYRILDITLKRTLRQRIWGLGTIHCCSSDATLKEFELRGVKNPRAVKDLLSQSIEAERVRKHVYQREMLGVDPDPHDHPHEPEPFRDGHDHP